LSVIHSSDPILPRDHLGHQNQMRISRQDCRKISSVGSLLLRNISLSYTHVVPHGRIYKPRGHPIERQVIHQPSTQFSSILHTREFSCNPPHKDPHQEVGCYVSQSGPNLQKIVGRLSCVAHEPLSYNQQHRPTQKHLEE
jgi:hypothetical protein